MKLYGLLGEKLGHSLSPEIHEQIFKNLNINGNYALFQIKKEDLFKVIEAINVLGISGVNVTIPYKQEIMKYLDFISEEARNIDAVNTIVFKDGKSYGYNTDYFGFQNMLKREDIILKDKIAVVLGTGGASKSVIQCLRDNKVKKIYMVSRNKESIKGNDNTDIIVVSYEELSNISGDMLINTTPVGMYPNINETPVNKDIISNFEVIVDIIYNPQETKLLRLGKELGLKTINGMYMLVDQAVKAEEIWQERVIDENISNEIYNKLSKMF
ncbi:shikimate dehydrogenase [Clostridium sp. 'White wine YQ']|uniref:shikimate dehydrogenase n=1 Tax=Clostridium sp. 'White wine YQ' TaxID=3027474 RepID=UPI00236705D0|nr:shikimate dehydrogenase [Clostridium sp. 'White wine YQ']MDD7794936.1 shikimate dehydrogenase [Clostridium sp. 'White wine YQ']